MRKEQTENRKKCRGRKILKGMGMVMTVSGGLLSAISILVIIHANYDPGAYAEACGPYVAELKGNYSPEDGYRTVVWILCGYLLVQSLLFLHSGVRAVRWSGRPDKARALRRKGIIMVLFSAIGLISGLIHMDMKPITNGLIDEAFNGLFLTGACLNVSGTGKKKRENENTPDGKTAGNGTA